MGKKVEYKREVKETSGDVAYVDIELPPVPNGYKRTLQHISCEDETTGCTELRIGYITQFGRRHWWIEQKTPQAGVLYWIDDEKRLQAGDKLVIRFTGTTDKDILAAYLDGFTEKVNPGFGPDVPQRGTGLEEGRARTASARGVGEPLTDAERAARHKVVVG